MTQKIMVNNDGAAGFAKNKIRVLWITWLWMERRTVPYVLHCDSSSLPVSAHDIVKPLLLRTHHVENGPPLEIGIPEFYYTLNMCFLYLQS